MSEPPTDPDDPYVGRTIAEKYRIEHQLGVGGVGTVYRALHVQLDRHVALKILRASLAADETTVARFTREARLASQLDHPNVMRVYDHGTEPDGLTYLTMELLEGSDLAAVISREAPLPATRTVEILAQVLAALGAAHRLGIVHRDLKPDNILIVTRTGDDGKPAEVVKVADFGIAKTYGEAKPGAAITQFGFVHGTPEYMSPEQASGDELDGRSDLYACGVLLYEMLCGRPPFVGETPIEVVEQHLRGAVVPPSRHRADVDPRLERIAMRALEKRPVDRYADAAEMRAALLAALEGPMPTSAETEAAPAPPPASHGVATSSVLIEMDEPAEIAVPSPDPSPSVVVAPTVPAPPTKAVPAPPAKTVPTRVPRRTLIAVGCAVAVALGIVVTWRVLAGRGTHVVGPVTSPTAQDAGSVDREDARDDSPRPTRRTPRRRSPVHR